MIHFCKGSISSPLNLSPAFDGHLTFCFHKVAEAPQWGSWRIQNLHSASTSFANSSLVWPVLGQSRLQSLRCFGHVVGKTSCQLNVVNDILRRVALETRMVLGSKTRED